MIISGIALILAAVFSLGEVVFAEQVLFLAQMTVVGLCLTGFGVVMWVQRLMLDKLLEFGKDLC